MTLLEKSKLQNAMVVQHNSKTGLVQGPTYVPEGQQPDWNRYDSNVKFLREVVADDTAWVTITKE